MIQIQETKPILLQSHRKELLIEFGMRWLNDENRIRSKGAELLNQELGLPLSMNHVILNQIFEKICSNQISSFIGQLETRHEASDKPLAYVIPSNVPDPFILAILGGWLLNRSLLLKIPEAMQRFCSYFCEQFDCFIPGIAKKIRIHTSRDSFFNGVDSCDTVIAYGHDETIRDIKHKLKKNIRFVGRGSRFSIGILLRSALQGHALKESVEKCAYDTWLYDQRGCLSPQVIFVQENPLEFAKKLQLKLTEFQREYGAPKRSDEMIQNKRTAIERMRAAHLDSRTFSLFGDVRRMNSPVVCVADQEFCFGAGGQYVIVRSFAEIDQVVHDMEPYRNHLECIGIAGFRSYRKQVVQKFAGTTVQRVCPIGEMQNPPLEWNI